MRRRAPLLPRQNDQIAQNKRSQLALKLMQMGVMASMAVEKVSNTRYI